MPNFICSRCEGGEFSYVCGRCEDEITQGNKLNEAVEAWRALTDEQHEYVIDVIADEVHRARDRDRIRGYEHSTFGAAVDQALALLRAAAEPEAKK